MSYILIKSVPWFDEDAWRVREHESVVLVFSNTQHQHAVKLCMQLNDSIDAYSNFMKASANWKCMATHLTDTINRTPPYETMVNIIGPKPVYDHALRTDVEYNKQHHVRVHEWKLQFAAWRASHPDEWKTIVTNLVNDRQVIAVEPELHPLLCNIHNEIEKSTDTARMPSFTLQQIADFIEE